MNTLLAYLKLLPAVVAAVHGLEQYIPLPGNGKAKLDLILQVVTLGYNTDQDVQGDLGKGFTLDKLVGIVTKIAGAVVSVFNALGIFQTTSAGTQSTLSPSSTMPVVGK